MYGKNKIYEGEREIDDGESEAKLQIRQVSVYDTVRKPSFLPLPDYFSPEYRCVIPWRPFVSTGSDPTQAAGRQNEENSHQPIRMTHHPPHSRESECFRTK